MAATTTRTSHRERGEGHLARPEWFSFAQMQALNPALVMILIPFNNLVLYPALRRWGVNVTPLRRMVFGIAFSGFAWIAAGAIQLAIDGGDAVSITWQVLHQVLLTFGEVLVSATGLEFALVAALAFGWYAPRYPMQITIKLRGFKPQFQVCQSVL